MAFQDPKEINSLDAEIVRLQKSTRTTVPALLPLHDVLRNRFGWYYNWSRFPFAKFFHTLFLIVFLFFIGGIFYNFFLGSPQEVFAASAVRDPSSDYTPQEWTASDGRTSNYYVLVSDSNDATYLYDNTADQEAWFNTATINNVFKVNQVDVTIRNSYTNTLGYLPNASHRIWANIYVGGTNQTRQSWQPGSTIANTAKTWSGTWYASGKTLRLNVETCDAATCGAGPWISGANWYRQNVFNVSSTVTYEQGPTGASTTNISDHSQRLNWTDNSTTEDRFKIYGGPSTVTSMGVNQNSYTFPNNQNAGQSYTLGVSSADASGESDIAYASALTTPLFEQLRYRIGDDAATGPTTSWKAAENTAASIDRGNNFRARFQFKNTGGSVSITPRIKYATSLGGTYNTVTTTCAGNPLCVVDNAAVANASFDPDTDTGLTNPGITKVNGYYFDTGSDATAATLAANNYTEYEWNVQLTVTATVGQAYYLRVYFNNDDNFQTYTNTATIAATLATPTNPYIDGVTTSAMVLRWTDISGEDDYHIERSTDGVNYSEVGTAAQNATSYSGAGTTGLSANTRYWFRVRAHATGYSSYATTQAITKITHLLPASEANKTFRLLANETKLAGEDGEVATFSRGSTNATYYDEDSGKLFTVDNSTDGRFEKAPASTTLGNPVPGSSVRVEEARTNLVLGSSFESDANSDGVADNFSGVSYGATFSLDSSTLRHGSYSQKITNHATDTSAAQRVQQQITLAASTTYTVSGWAKSSNGFPYVRVDLDVGGAKEIYSPGQITHDWTYFSGSFTTDPTTTYGTLRLYNVIIADATVNYDAIQIEAGAFATSYIPTTTTAVARSAEVLTYPVSGNISGTAGTLSMWINPDWGTDTDNHYSNLFTFGSPGASGFMLREGPNNDYLQLQYYGASTITLGYTATIAANTWHHIIIKWGASGVDFWVDGQSRGSNAVQFTDPGSSGSFYVGGRPGYVGANALISDLTIFSTVLSDPQALGLYYQNGPTNVTMDTPTAGGLTVHWSDNSSNETNFTLQRSQTDTCAGASYGSDTTASANDTSKAITGLSPNLQYCYQLKATVSTHNSPYAQSASASYSGANAPLGPTLVANSWDATNGNSLTATIAENSNPAATEFAIACDAIGTNWLQNDGSCSGSKVWKTKSTWETGTTNYLKNLAADTDYSIVTLGRNGDNVETANSPASGTVKTAPAQPTITGQTHNGITGHTTNTINSITWAWNGNATAPGGYKVYEYTTSCTATEKGSVVHPTTSVVESTGFTANTSYARCLKGYRGAITGQPSTNFSAYTSANVPTSANHSANTTTGISWSWATGGAQKDYYASDSTGNSGYIVGTSWDASTGHSANTQYTLTAKARNGDNDETTGVNANAYTSIENPTGITATADNTSQISLVATGTLSNLAAGSSGLTFSEIQGNPGGGGQTCFTDWTQTNSCSDTGLNANTMYRYNVTARNGDGDPSDTYSFQQRYTLIQTPTNITPGLITPNSIAITMTDSLSNLSTGSSGIQFAELSGNQGGGGETAFTTWPQTTSTTDTGLRGALSGNVGTTYKYKVKARNAEGAETVLSPEFEFTTTAGTQLLFKLPGETLDESGAYLLSYSDPTPNTVVAGVPFNIEIKAADPANYRDLAHQDTIVLASGDPVAQFPTAAAMTNGQINYNGIIMKTVGNQTISGSGSAGSSHEFAVVAGECSPGDSTVTASPTSLYVDQTSTVTITLMDSFGNKLAGHAVSVSSDQAGDVITFSAAQTDANGRIYAYVTSPTAHTSTITARDTTDGVTLTAKPQITFNPVVVPPTPTPTATPTPTPTVSPGDNEAPTAPSNLRATDVTSTTIDLAWDPSTDNVGVAGYELYNVDTNILITVTSLTVHDLRGLTPETTYRFHVRAFDAARNFSPFSNILTITTLPLGPGEEEEEVVVYLVMGGLPKEVNAGQPFPENVRVSAVDGGGKIVTGYDKAIYFSSSDKNAKLTYSEKNHYTYTALDAGIHEFEGKDFVLNTAGTQKLTVSDHSTASSVEILVRATTALPVVRDFLTKPENLSKVNTGVVITTAAILLTPLLINTALNFGTLLPQLIYWAIQLLQLLGIRKRRKSWGVVFNSQTGQPISLAIVRILDKRYNRVLEQAVTDNQGRFGFLVREGTFYITISKSGFSFPSKEKTSSFYEKIYTGGDFKVAGKDQTVAYNIPLDPQVRPGLIISLWVFSVRLTRFLEKLRLPLLVIGIIFSVIMMIVAFEAIYLLSLIFYILLGILEYLRTRKARPYGVVTDTFNHPLETVIVRIYKKENNRLIETDVTDRDGRFRFLVAPGVYYLAAAKPGYVDFKSHLMYLQKEKTQVSTTIKLKKEEK